MASDSAEWLTFPELQDRLGLHSRGDLPVTPQTASVLVRAMERTGELESNDDGTRLRFRPVSPRTWASVQSALRRILSNLLRKS